MVKFPQKGVYMLVSAISSIPYGMYSNSQTWYVNSKSNETETTPDNFTPSDNETADCTDCKLYSGINKWKHFCCKQIDAGNLDFIA